MVGFLIPLSHGRAADSACNGFSTLLSSIFFDNCTFDDGLTIVDDYHAIVSLDSSCSFGDDSALTCREVTRGAVSECILAPHGLEVIMYHRPWAVAGRLKRNGRFTAPVIGINVIG